MGSCPSSALYASGVNQFWIEYARRIDAFVQDKELSSPADIEKIVTCIEENIAVFRSIHADALAQSKVVPEQRYQSYVDLVRPLLENIVIIENSILDTTAKVARLRESVNNPVVCFNVSMLDQFMGELADVDEALNTQRKLSDKWIIMLIILGNNLLAS